MKPVLRRALWLVAIAGTAAAVAWVDDNDGGAPAGAATQNASPSRGSKKSAEPSPLPVLQLAQLDARAFGDMKADPFAARSWYVAPPPPPPAQPRPPPLPFTYSGRMIEDGKTTVFLDQQGRNQPVRSGDVIANTWRVDAIGDTSMSFTYLPLNESQTLALGAAP